MVLLAIALTCFSLNSWPSSGSLFVWGGCSLFCQLMWQHILRSTGLQHYTTLRVVRLGAPQLSTWRVSKHNIRNTRKENEWQHCVPRHGMYPAELWITVTNLVMFTCIPCTAQTIRVLEHTARQTSIPWTTLDIIWFNHTDHILPPHHFRENHCFLLQNMWLLP